MGFCSNGGDSGAIARQQEEERQAKIKTGIADVNQTFGAFDDKFYKQRAQDYTNFAMPQLYQQLGEANRQGTYALANRGLQVGSAANQFGSNLNREAATQKQGIVDAGLGQAQQLRQNVEGQRNQVVAQLQASADPTTAAQQALAAASSFSMPSAFQPLGQLFQGITQLYANNQTANAMNSKNYQSQYGSTSPLANRSYSLK